MSITSPSRICNQNWCFGAHTDRIPRVSRGYMHRRRIFPTDYSMVPRLDRAVTHGGVCGAWSLRGTPACWSLAWAGQPRMPLLYALLYECMFRIYASYSHSYTHLILGLGIVRKPTVWGFITSHYPGIHDTDLPSSVHARTRNYVVTRTPYFTL